MSCPSAQMYAELAARLRNTDELISDEVIEQVLQLRQQAVGELAQPYTGKMLVYREALSVWDQMWQGETEILNAADCPHGDYWIASGGQLRRWCADAAAEHVTLLAWIPASEIAGAQQAINVTTGAAVNWACDDESDAVVALSSAVQRE